MVFPYGCIDIVFRKDVLRNKALLDTILERYKPTQSHIDDKLILVRCAMNPIDAKIHVEKLEKEFGLTYIKDNKATDFVVVEKLFARASCSKCDWLKSDRLKENLIIGQIEYKQGETYFEFIE